jgi:hypothetical protein
MLQIVILSLIVGMLFAGEGYYTHTKILLANAIIALIAATCLLYISINIVMMVLWCLKQKGKDYLTEWTKQDQEDSCKSLSENDMLSDIKINKG